MEMSNTEQEEISPKYLGTSNFSVYSLFIMVSL